jgi:hypothetical protein
MSQDDRDLVYVALDDMTDQEVQAQVQLLFSAGETEHARELQRYLDAGRPPREIDRIQAIYTVREDLVPISMMTHEDLLAEAAQLKVLASTAAPRNFSGVFMGPTARGTP